MDILPILSSFTEVADVGAFAIVIRLWWKNDIRLNTLETKMNIFEKAKNKWIIS